MFRNIVGMMVDRKILPVRIDQLFKKPTKDKLKERLKSNVNQKVMNKLFKARKSMKYTIECINRFKNDIQRLFERLHRLHNSIDEKANGKKLDPEFELNEIDMKEMIVDSCSLEQSFLFSWY